MDSNKDTERHFEDWMPSTMYEPYKQNFIRVNQQQFIDNLNSLPQFDDLTKDQKDLGAKLLTTFIFGLHMAYKRIGMKYENYDVTFDVGEKGDYDAIAYWQDENAYVVRASWFKQEIKDIEKGKEFYESPAGIEGDVPISDLFEIAGVEEAAHYIFYNEKEGKELKSPFETGDKHLNYYTKEAEERALIWKKAYAKHYMPKYYDSLAKLSINIRELRNTSKVNG